MTDNRIEGKWPAVRLLLVSTFRINVLLLMSLPGLGSRTYADERKSTVTVTSAEVAHVLRQLRRKLPNKSDDEIIQVLRSHVASDRLKERNGINWLSQQLQSAKTQHAAVQGIQEWAGLVFFDYQVGDPGTLLPHAQLKVPAGLIAVLGSDFFAVAVEASLGNGGIEHVGKLTRLRRLNVSAPNCLSTSS